MAKDDYFVIAFKALAYLYAVLKGKEVFSQKNKYDPPNLEGRSTKQD